MSSDDPTSSSELRAIARAAAQRVMSGTDAGAGSVDEAGASASRRPLGATNRTKLTGPTSGPRHRSESEEPELVAESLVLAAPRGSELVIPPGARITPLAKEVAFERGVTFVTGRSAEPLARSGSARPPARIAVASDHGGFALKQELMPLLREMGQRPHDLGPPDGETSVDYPDFAARVALEVSEGRAHLGIIVDGAGIGSAIVANKLPGVFAANCWNVASARNAREHNHANVLTLGSGHLDLAAARNVIAAFLGTSMGDGRHARRAEKARAVEAQHLRTRELARTFDEGRDR